MVFLRSLNWGEFAPYLVVNILFAAGLSFVFTLVGSLMQRRWTRKEIVEERKWNELRRNEDRLEVIFSYFDEIPEELDGRPARDYILFQKEYKRSLENRGPVRQEWKATPAFSIDAEPVSRTEVTVTSYELWLLQQYQYQPEKEVRLTLEAGNLFHRIKALKDEFDEPKNSKMDSIRRGFRSFTSFS